MPFFFSYVCCVYSLLGFEIDCMGPAALRVLFMIWMTGLMLDRVGFSNDSSVCCILVQRKSCEKQMTIQ